jgi:Transglycosylase-like domain/LysM domain
MLSSKRTPNRKFSTLTVAGGAIAAATIAAGAAASAATVAGPTTHAKTTTATTATVHSDHARFLTTERRFSDGPAASSDRPAAYTVKPGDSLSSITGRLFGHADLWPRFYAANVKVVGAYPDQITPGERFTVKLARRGLTGNVTPPIQGNVTPAIQQAPAATQPGISAVAASQGTAQGGSFGSCVRSRESGGNYQATNSGGYYGAYQFSASTWAAYGGNPADFGNASAAEQDQVFANAMAQGGESNWAPYDGC